MTLQWVLDGVIAAATLALGATGVTLTYSNLRFANFAHGEFISWGAYLALTLAALATLHAQRLERAHAAFVTGTPGLDALADPHLFLGQALVEQRVGGRLGSQFGLLVHQEAGVVAVPVDQAATVQFQDARRQVLQE